MTEDRIEVIFGAQIASLLAGLEEAKAAVVESTEGMTTAFEGMEAAISTAMAPLLAITAVLEGGEIFGEAISKAAEFGKQLEVASQKTGMEVEQLSALQYAANLSDVSVGDLTIGLQRLSRGMEEAEKSTGPAYEAMNALGIRAMDAQGHLRPMHDVLLDLAARFRGMEDGAGKTALAMDLFGRSGANLIPLLNQGSEGITELEQRARELGVTMSDDGVIVANQYVDVMKEFHAVMDSIQRDIAIMVMPKLTALGRFFETSKKHVTEWADEIWRGVTGFSFIKAMEVDDHWAAMLAKASLPTAPAKTAAPDMSATSVPELQRWIEDLNVRKESAIKNGEDLKQVELEFWKAKLAIAKEGTAEYMEIHSKIVAIEEEQSRTATDLAKKAAKETFKEWVDVFDAFPAAFTHATDQIGKSVFSLRDLFRDLFTDLVQMSAVAGLRMLRDHTATELAKKNATVAGVVARVAAEAWGALIIIGNHAATAVAAAWASISAIPFVGPFLAPAVAVGTGAAVLALASGVKSAAGGYDVPSGINPMTQLHAQEMVLPADLANRIRGMTGGADASAETHLHFHSLDPKTAAQWARENPEVFGIGVAGAISMNHGGLNRALRNRV
jgi:hypothetical protein